MRLYRLFSAALVGLVLAACGVRGPPRPPRPEPRPALDGGAPQDGFDAAFPAGEPGEPLPPEGSAPTPDPGEPAVPSSPDAGS